MPWTPVSNQENALKQDIKMKRFNPVLFATDAKEEHKTSQINYVYKLLLNANNYKQAVAVLGAINSLDDIKKISDYGFNLITDNSSTTVKATLGLIPAVLLQRKQEKIIQDNLNAHINGYLMNIHTKYEQHQKGTIQEDGLPLKKNGTEIWAVYYNNDLSKLPYGNNIEWYPFVSSTRSAHKRFFTHRNSVQLWFSDGGTHGNVDDWWTQTVAKGNWKKC